MNRKRPRLSLRQIARCVDAREAAGAGGRHGDVFDPAFGSVAAQVALAGAKDVDAAVAARIARFRRGAKRRHSSARASRSRSRRCSTRTPTNSPH